jgi:hypothetical protein
MPSEYYRRIADDLKEKAKMGAFYDLMKGKPFIISIGGYKLDEVKDNMDYILTRFPFMLGGVIDTRFRTHYDGYIGDRHAEILIVDYVKISDTFFNVRFHRDGLPVESFPFHDYIGLMWRKRCFEDAWSTLKNDLTKINALTLVIKSKMKDVQDDISTTDKILLKMEEGAVGTLGWWVFVLCKRIEEEARA